MVSCPLISFIDIAVIQQTIAPADASLSMAVARLPLVETEPGLVDPPSTTPSVLQDSVALLQYGSPTQLYTRNPADDSIGILWNYRNLLFGS